MDKEKIDFLVTVAENCGSITLSREDFLQLVRELDAAVEDLKLSALRGISVCRLCKNSRECSDDINFSCKWEWRGVQDG